MSTWQRPQRTGLWSSPDFLRLWGGQTVSIFGSLVTGLALPYLAILELDANALDIAAIKIAELLPAFLAGLFAGVWIDRLPKRRVMIAADLARGLSLAILPFAAWSGHLTLVLVVLVAALLSVGGVIFDIAYQSYIPALVGQEHVLEANAKMAGSAYVVELPAFSLAGWLVQLLGAPLAVLTDCLTFLWSAYMLGRIEQPDRVSSGESEREHIFQEAVSGVGFIRQNEALKGLATSNTLFALATSLVSSVFLLYLTQEIGLGTGWQGMIFAIGGIGAVLGSLFTRRLTSKFGVGKLLIGSLLIVSACMMLPPIVQAVTIAGVALLIVQQLLMDPFWGIYEILGMSTRQSMIEEGTEGRVNATFRVLELGAMLTGTIIGGVTGTTIGLRPVLVLAAVVSLFSVLPLLLSPVRSIIVLPAVELAEQ